MCGDSGDLVTSAGMCVYGDSVDLVTSAGMCVCVVTVVT